MIRNLIFDFGNVFINLDTEATVGQLQHSGIKEIPPALYEMALEYEKGMHPTHAFVDRAVKLLPGLNETQLIDAWNAILLDFPQHRLQFINELANSGPYALFLLSNSNEMHIASLTRRLGSAMMDTFFSCFRNVYFSHQLGMRKPEALIFETLLEQEGLRAEESFFIDDTKENIEAASRLGLHTWHLQAGEEDITELLSRLP